MSIRYLYMIADEGLPKASINADKYSDELSFSHTAYLQHVDIMQSVMMIQLLSSPSILILDMRYFA